MEGILKRDKTFHRCLIPFKHRCLIPFKQRLLQKYLKVGQNKTLFIVIASKVQFNFDFKRVYSQFNKYLVFYKEKSIEEACSI